MKYGKSLDAKDNSGAAPTYRAGAVIGKVPKADKVWDHLERSQHCLHLPMGLADGIGQRLHDCFGAVFLEHGIPAIQDRFDHAIFLHEGSYRNCHNYQMSKVAEPAESQLRPHALCISRRDFFDTCCGYPGEWVSQGRGFARQPNQPAGVD